MIPSEVAIDEAIERLAPGAFQQLVEAYARVAFPGRFARLAVHGRNSRSQPTAGWPDAYAVLPDGRLDAVEATRDARNWRVHLGNDLEQAARLRKPGLGGFLFVAWASTPQPGALQPERKALLELGADAESIDFTFRADLVAALRSPAFAAIWQDLGLSASAWPFIVLSKAPIFGDGGAELFAPSREEIARGIVHLPAAASVVAEHLERDGWALVLGRGASGKTVLAGALGVGWEERGAPCYYLDLAPAGGTLAGSTPALEVLASRAAPNALFIIDNIHRDDAFAAAVHDHWRQVGAGSRLLLLGRDTASETVVLGVRSPLAVLRAQHIPLRVGREDLRGVWLRLNVRRGGSPGATPPPEALDEWLRLFGGDLIAFSAAIALRGCRPAGWSLRADDARTYVETRYLATLDAEARRALLAVAQWSTIELALPVVVGLASALVGPVADGIVERTDDGYAGHRTIHPGLAALIVAASPGEPYSMLLEQIDDVPDAIAVEAARRLLARGERDHAARCVARHTSDAAGVIRFLLVAGAARIATQARLLRQLLGDERLTELSQLTEGVAAELVGANAEALLGLLTQARSLPSLTAAVRVIWLGLPEEDQARLAASIATFTVQEDLGHAPLTFRRVRRVGHDVFAAVLEAFVQLSGVEMFFAARRRLPLARWDDLASAAQGSSVFRRRLLDVLSGPEAVVWPLLVASDGPKLLERLHMRDPELSAVLKAHVARDDFRSAAIARALTSGPGRFLSLAMLAHAFNPALLRDIVRVCRGNAWIAALGRWQSASTKYPRMKEWAHTSSPELAAAIVRGEKELSK